VEVLFAGTTGATFCVFRLVTRFGCVVVGDGIGGAVIVGVGVVVVGVVVVGAGAGAGAVVVGDDSESDCEEYVSSPVVIVNASVVSVSGRSNPPTAVQFPGEAHDTDSNHAHVNSFCMLSSNTAGCAVSHSPSVMVMMNAMVSSPSALNSPTAVQFPGDAHDTDFKLVFGVSSCMSSSNTAGCGVSHSPSVDVMVNASWSPELFLKYPTAVQFPGVAHDTDSKPALGVSSCMSASNSAGCASSHTPSVNVMVNASLSPELFLKYPTAVQFPGVAHDTDSKSA
jgi:hypothetical protein